DVRIIVATNRKLHEAVAAGKFREDLFYRLQVVPRRTPPLRQRPEDIPLLIEAFLDHFAKQHGRRRKRLDPEALSVCRRYPWPGNVRQLRNLVERLVVTCPETKIGVAQLPDFLVRHEHEAPEF